MDVPRLAARRNRLVAPRRERHRRSPVTGADGYNVYRNNREPRDFNDLGLPLGSTYGDELSYEDRLSLKAQEYYYSIVPTDGLDEYEVRSWAGSHS